MFTFGGVQPCSCARVTRLGAGPPALLGNWVGESWLPRHLYSTLLVVVGGFSSHSFELWAELPSRVRLSLSSSAGSNFLEILECSKILDGRRVKCESFWRQSFLFDFGQKARLYTETLTS